MFTTRHSDRRRFLYEWMALGVTLVVIGTMFAGFLIRDRHSVEAQEADQLQRHARIVDENLIRQLEGANRALEGVRDDVARRGLHSDDAATLTELKLLTSSMPGVSTMAVLDAGGTVVASTRDELVGRNFQSREYFDVPQRDLDPAKLYVSPPFRTTFGTYVVTVSRVLKRPSGEFLGVVTASLYPDYFNVVLGSVLYAPDMLANLIHANGKLFLAMPADQALNGADFTSADSVFVRHQRSGQESSLFDGVSIPGSEPRMVVLRTLSSRSVTFDNPLVVAVSRQLSAIYSTWDQRAQRTAAAWLTLAALLAFGLHFDQRRRKSLGQLAAAAASEQHSAAERTELALRSAHLGLWDVHLPTGAFVVNSREREILGFRPDDDLSDTVWRTLIHPDDWPKVSATFIAHRAGGTDAYECEHRMRHGAGHWIWVSSHAMIVERDLTGAPVRLVGTHLDITDRRQADAELARTTALLQDSKERLREVMDNIPALVSRLDREQRFLFANRAYGDWLGLEPDALLGRTLQDVYGTQAIAALQPYFQAALSGEHVTYERQMATPTGPRQVQVTLVPHRETSGRVESLFALINDITARYEAEQKHRRSEERLNLALEGSGQGLFDWDIENNRMYHSAQTAAMRGEVAAESVLSAEEMRAFVNPDDLPDMLAAMTSAIKGEIPLYEAEFRIRTRDGDWLWIRAHGRVVERNPAGRARRLAGTYANISARKREDERLRRLAEIDPLTDLPNRALFRKRLQQSLLRATPQEPMALFFLDIDHFKAVNDTLGHEAGDHLLQIFARRMRETIRESDMVARLAGDEFTVIVEGLQRAEDAQAVAAKLLAALRDPIALAGKVLVVTASVGVANYKPGESDPAEILRRADAALYEAKRKGRDGYFCEPAASPSIAQIVASNPTGHVIH